MRSSVDGSFDSVPLSTDQLEATTLSLAQMFEGEDIGTLLEGGDRIRKDGVEMVVIDPRNVRLLSNVAE